MVAYERYITVENAGRLTISGLPLSAGQRVRVTITVDEQHPKGQDEDLRSLLRDTQAVPAAQRVTDDEIAAQITAARHGSA